MEFCVVEKKLLKAYVEAANRYWALEGHGVDNWDGYGEAFEEYIEFVNEDEDVDFIFKDFNDIVEYDLKKMNRRAE